MLAKKYEDYEDKITYPVYIQPKLDGLRCVIYLAIYKGKSPADATYKNVTMYTREKKPYPFNENNVNIRRALLPTLIKFYDKKRKESIYLDGELYTHGVSLQDINKTRSTKSNPTSIIQYHIYDMFYPHYNKKTFKRRYSILEDFISNLSKVDQEYIQLVETTSVSNIKKQTALFENYLSDDYEGSIIRDPESIYLKHKLNKSTTLRSKGLLKRKPVYDDEFEVVGYTQGKKGKNVGAIEWCCITEDGAKFKADPTGDMAVYTTRYKLFQECEANDGQGFIDKYKGRMLTIEYRGWTKDGKPFHAKAVRFRDYE